MTTLNLLLRTIRRFWRADLAVAAGMAVATAVLSGALMVGDSVRGSLRQLAVDRLGPVRYALAGPQMFSSSLAQRLAEQAEFERRFGRVSAGLALQGGATVPTEDPLALPVHVADVQVLALDPWLSHRAGQIGQDASVVVSRGECVLNGRLADDLGVAVGDRIELDLPRASDLPPDATLARRGRTDVRAGLTVVVARIERGRNLVGLFSLSPSQRTPRNAWVNLSELRETVGRTGRANLLLATGGEDDRPAVLNELLAATATLEDYGLRLARPTRPAGAGSTSGPATEAATRPDRPPARGPRSAFVALTSQTTYLSPPAQAVALDAAGAVGAQPVLATVYMANAAWIDRGSPSTQPYPPTTTPLGRVARSSANRAPAREVTQASTRCAAASRVPSRCRSRARGEAAARVCTAAANARTPSSAATRCRTVPPSGSAWSRCAVQPRSGSPKP